MKKTNMKWILSLLFILPACSYFEYQEPVYQVLPYQEDMIGLQNLETRVLVYCYHSDSIPTEECAQEFEKRGIKTINIIKMLSIILSKIISKI